MNNLVQLILNWLVATLAIVIATYLVPAVEVAGFFAALVAALVLGVVNAFLRPLLILLTLPLNILTVGLFTFVINALLVMLTSLVVPGFTVPNFWWALLFSLVLMLVNVGIHMLSRDEHMVRVQIERNSN